MVGYIFIILLYYMKALNFEQVPTYLETDTIEEWRYTEMFTDMMTIVYQWDLSSLIESLQEARNADGIWRYKRLEEFSNVIQHYWEIVMNLNNVKILWYKEHSIIHDKVKQKEIEDAWLSYKPNVWPDSK